MPALPGESLRAQARREGITVYQARVSRTEARGISRSVAAGKPRPGERGLRPPVRVQRFLRDAETVKFRRYGADLDKVVTITTDKNGDTEVKGWTATEWQAYADWLDWWADRHDDFDWEEYF